MRRLRFTARYAKDFRQFKKHRRLSSADYQDLSHVLDLLRAGVALPASYSEHVLKNEYAGYTECHVDEDWLLIYKPSSSEVVIHRVGTHKTLFP